LLSAFAAWRNPFLVNKEKVQKDTLLYDEQIY